MVKDESTWIADTLANNPWVGGALMAAATASLRVIYDQKETHWVRIILESLICGMLTVAVGSALVAMGYGQNWYLFCGGAIGFMGSQSVRALANNILRKNID